MLKDGDYAAWFKTPAGEGTGTVHLDTGRISGRDSILTYAGSYETDGERFTAVIRTKRHTPGHRTVFGVDDLTLRLTGHCKDTLAVCTGAADEVPGMPFEATLLRSQGEEPEPRREWAPVKFDPDRLPKPPSR
ncbi:MULTISPECIES: hypothetical protein [unclassified Bradyrhizobium]|uniref:hypothetical protein n=1 Tax=unclassified Bradyrhizobium TaxID=2631580 RepID=UPI0028E73ED7|nr:MULTISPECIES: hypothetical protein [unclassified Bradyrhizobium]